MTDSQAQRDFAMEVVRQLHDAGYEALWAGGCVRDQLLGNSPKDYDVATSALPEQVREVFGKRRTIAVGASFGVIVVLGPKQAGQIDVATFRADVSYSDGRRPDSVRFTTAEEDASRRDFTINGLFYDPIDERVIDYVGGEADLATGVVRAIGDPTARFAEDRLRMLRAVRFSATLRFELDSHTAQAVREQSQAICEVSPERIGIEMKRMLSDPERGEAVALLQSTGLLSHVLPPLKDVSDEAIVRIRERLDRLQVACGSLGLAATLLDAANHDQVAEAGRALRWTNKEVHHAAWLVDHQNALDGAENRPWSEVQPVLAHEGSCDLVELRAATLGQRDATDAFCREKLMLAPEQLNPSPLVEGADLIAAGQAPGPQFKELLNRARAAQLDGIVKSKQEALELLGLQ